MRPGLIPISLVAATTALGSACDGDRETNRDNAQRAPTVTLTATDYAFDAPDSLQEGWNTFHLVNNGKAFHAAMMVRLEEGQTLEEFRAVYAEALRNNGPWNTIGLLGGIVGPPPNGAATNATLYLAAGHYAWYCPLGFEDGIPHVVGHGMLQPFVVTPRDDSATPTAPEPSITITMVDYAYQLSAPMTAGRHVIRVENTGPEPHELLFMKLAPDRTLGDVHTWLVDPRNRPPFSEVLGGVVIERVGDEAYFEVELSTGTYVLYCVITARDGRRHWEHGMLQQIQVD